MMNKRQRKKKEQKENMKNFDRWISPVAFTSCDAAKALRKFKQACLGLKGILIIPPPLRFLPIGE